VSFSGYLNSIGVKADDISFNSAYPFMLAKALNHTASYTNSEKIYADGGQLNVLVGPSYTAYTMKGSGDFLTLLKDMKAMVSSYSCTSDGFIQAQKDASEEISKLIAESTKKDGWPIWNQMFPEESLSDFSVGYKDSISKISQTGLRKYFETFFSSKDMLLVIVGNVVPDEIYKQADELATVTSDASPVLVIPSFEDKSKNYPSYDFQKKSSDIFNASEIQLGLRFPMRKKLYEEYGDDLFAIYSFLPYTVLGLASPFYKKAYKKGLFFSMSSAKIIQQGEYAFLYYDFYTICPNDFIASVKKYLPSLPRHISFLEFLIIKRYLLGRSIQAKFSQDIILQDVIEAEMNHLNLGDLEIKEAGLSYKKFKSFVKKAKSFSLSVQSTEGKSAK
jgi:predicted Zn-dependent peptidase